MLQGCQSGGSTLPAPFSRHHFWCFGITENGAALNAGPARRGLLAVPGPCILAWMRQDVGVLGRQTELLCLPGSTAHMCRTVLRGTPKWSTALAGGVLSVGGPRTVMAAHPGHRQ